LGEEEAASKLEKAVATVLDHGYRTGDIFVEGMNKVSTSDMGERVAEALERVI